jgi:hypothetical protein
MGLWPSPDSIEGPKFYNFSHDGTLSTRKFVLIMVQTWWSVASRPLKLHTIFIWVLWYSIDQEFHVDEENTRESQC